MRKLEKTGRKNSPHFICGNERGCYRLRVNVELEVKDTESQSQTEAVIRSYIKFLQGLEQEASAHGTDFVLNLKIK